MTRDPLRRAGDLERLGALLARGVPAALALASVGAGRAAVALAEEGRPVDEALLAAGLIGPADAGLVRAGDPARGLALLGREVRARHEVGRAFRRAALQPFLKLAVALVVFVGIGVTLGGGRLLPPALTTPTGLGGVLMPAQPEGEPVTLRERGAVWGGVALALLLGAALSRTGPAPRLLERAARDLPVVSGLLELEVAARYLRALGTSLDAGLDLPAALSRARDAFAGRATARDLEPILAAARQGHGLVACLGRAPLNMPTAQWVAGATTARAEPAGELLALADAYEARLVRECARWGPVLGGVADLLIVVCVGASVLHVMGGTRGLF
ncbi:MAG: hypothetical protein KF878_31765 [Planctomycetes bacterium]|nr:hypothetical protein [Planctomycetota bacterium]